MDLESIARDLSERFSHRRWILVSDVIVSATPTVARLREWGGREFLVIGSARGVGDEPDARVVLVPHEPVSIMESFRRFVRMVEDPPAQVREAVARFDPNGSARALGPMFACPNEFLGRHLYGTRPRSWEDLEDKTRADAIWDEAGVPRAPSEVVRVVDAPDAAARLATSEGAVWAADNTEGWHGGGESTRWVAGADDAASASDWFGGRFAAVRVMPFLDGIPCSIHGFVTSDGVGVGRPVELLILRRSDRTGFVYAGVATVWDPPDSLRREMREAARRVGEVLRRRVGYRGPFGIDGVATSSGFRPTELNPRWSVGFAAQMRAVEGLDAMFFVRSVVEGDLDPVAADLEEMVTTAADADRHCHVGMSFPVQRPEDSFEVDAAHGGGTVAIGSSPTGCFVRWAPDVSCLRVGESLAPAVVSVWAMARQRWELPVPDLVPARAAM